MLPSEMGQYVNTYGNLALDQVSGAAGEGPTAEVGLKGQGGQTQIKIDRHTQIHMEEDIHRESTRMFHQETKALTLMVKYNISKN
jgi:hypothetical protein